MSADQSPTPLNTALTGGRTLIEASAGSGKTRAITTLVARLVVEQGLELDSILVVTFTKPATAELRNRIRKTLKAIQDAIGSAGNADDDQASELLERWEEIEELDEERIRARIDLALLDIDRANILTIHGFCQRALKEFAFETGFPFGFEVSGDGAGIVESVVRDIWQRNFRDSSLVFANHVAKKKFMPAELAKWFGSLRAKLFRDVRGVPDQPIQPPEAENACRAVLESALATWRGHGEEFRQIMLDTTALNKTSYPPAKIDNQLEWITAIFAGGVLPVEIDELAKCARYLGAKSTSGKCRKGHQLPENPMFEAFDELADACAALSESFNTWFRHIRRQLVEEAGDDIRRLIRTERRLGYDDLLIEMRDALARESAGPRLAENIRRRFPVALIDEFQDTDPTQERIFSSIYGNREVSGGEDRPDQSSALYIVGDPKQSIYQFRGADIFAYLSAQQGTDSSLQLGHNWRSVPGLVDAVNAMFDAPLAFTIPEIGFTPAMPGRDDETRLKIDGEASSPFTFWLADDQPNIGSATALVADETANDVVRVLDLARAGKARLGERPLRASDIAVLVSTRAQGREIAKALRGRGGKSVEIDDSNVFETREAEQVHRLLLAVANPGRQDYRRAALTGDLFGLDSGQLLALSEDDESWNRWAQQFMEWRDYWRSRGVGAMLRTIVDAEGGAGNLLRYADGPRRLTNLYHLTELLQEAETENRHSPAGILAWLKRRLEGQAGTKEGEEDAFTLRLDNDEDLVRILTIHKSKGLEFPIVYLPFAWYGRQIGTRSDEPVSFHVRDGKQFPAILDLNPDDSSRNAQLMEDFGESVRRLYVALTRARDRCVVAWTRIASGRNKELPPLAWLMHGYERGVEMLGGLEGGSMPASDSAIPDGVAEAHAGIQADFRNKSREDFRADVAAVANKCPQAIEIREIGDVAPALAQQAEKLPDLECREFSRATRRIRQMTSFTALSADHAATTPAHLFIEPGAPDHDEAEGDVDAESNERETLSEPSEHNAFNFPRGIQVGSCLHRIFEILDEEPNREVDQVCSEQLDHAGIEVKWRSAARQMVENTRDTELLEPGQCGFRLAEIDKRLTELEFFFPVNGLRRSGLGELLERSGYPDLLNGGHDKQTIDGYLRGFIDLTFEHEGRWYVLDYKSNWLGNQAEDYEPERLGHAMREHRYQLQYLIYLLALHRYLRTRLPDYDYERHIGGAFYLFLRGMDPAAGMTRGVWFDRPSKQCIDALDDFMGGGGS
ncbi:MAG: exodeoxyribonuclease V subunit beta [Gammaproteobacteria bacterium]|nr:exodeoxyribonuclease V subunit beta [Gammaproteobacteria bacterium]